MIRRRNSISLSRRQPAEEDVNPNAYLTNIADCMLVLMLGTIVALIAYYGVDLESASSEQEEQITGVEVSMDADNDSEIDEQYQESGRVYYDPSTDTYYFVASEDN